MRVFLEGACVFSGESEIQGRLGTCGMTCSYSWCFYAIVLLRNEKISYFSIDMICMCEIKKYKRWSAFCLSKSRLLDSLGGPSASMEYVET